MSAPQSLTMASDSSRVRRKSFQPSICNAWFARRRTMLAGGSERLMTMMQPWGGNSATASRIAE